MYDICNSGLGRIRVEMGIISTPWTIGFQVNMITDCQEKTRVRVTTPMATSAGKSHSLLSSHHRGDGKVIHIPVTFH